jgi:hypothetical protein
MTVRFISAKELWGDWAGVFDRVAHALSELVTLHQNEDIAELDLEQN